MYTQSCMLVATILWFLVPNASYTHVLPSLVQMSQPARMEMAMPFIRRLKQWERAPSTWQCTQVYTRPTIVRGRRPILRPPSRGSLRPELNPRVLELSH